MSNYLYISIMSIFVKSPLLKKEKEKEKSRVFEKRGGGVS
jgi:hypothetical protein